MKIALIVPGGVDRSGTERVIPCLLWLIERLVRGGGDVHVFALHQEDQPGKWPLLGAEVHNAGQRPRRLRALSQLMAEHRRSQFDVAHAFWAAGPGIVGGAFKLLAGVPCLVTLPGGDLCALRDISYGGRMSWRGRLWTGLALVLANRVIVPSEWMRQQADALDVNAIRIPLGVALDRWPAAPPRRRLPEDRLRLLHVANLNQVKDQETLLLAMHELRNRNVDFHLDIIGLDTLHGAVHRRCTELGLSNWTSFHGFMPHAELRTWMQKADMLVVSSRHEGGPLVLAEAAVAGVPTVGTMVGQLADWSPKAAVAVPVRDYSALAEAIITLANDEDRRLAIAVAAQRLALAEDADFTALRTLSLYEELRSAG